MAPSDTASVTLAKDAGEELAQLVQQVDSAARYQIEWYQTRKRRQRRYYYAAGVVTVVAGSLVPLLTQLPVGPEYREVVGFATAAAGTLVVVTSSLSAFFRWHLNWVNYTAAQQQIESLYRAWQIQISRTHAITGAAARMARARELSDNTLAQIDAIRRAEAAVTLPPDLSRPASTTTPSAPPAPPVAP